MYIPTTAIERLVEAALEDKYGLGTVNHVEVDTRLRHGDDQIASITAYVEVGGPVKAITVTLGIDIKERKNE